jgi:undecaprenyl-diphosphatase
LSITLALLARRSWIGGIALALMSALVAWARIFLGVHFPLDMVGSLAMAVIAVLMTQRMWLHKGAWLLSLFEALLLLLLSFLPFKFVRSSNRR